MGEMNNNSGSLVSGCNCRVTPNSEQPGILALGSVSLYSPCCASAATRCRPAATLKCGRNAGLHSARAKTYASTPCQICQRAGVVHYIRF